MDFKPGFEKKTITQSLLNVFEKKFKEDLQSWGGFRRHGGRWSSNWLKIAGEDTADGSKWSSDVIPKSIGPAQEISSSGSRQMKKKKDF